MTSSKTDSAYVLIDVNLNRSREGLRVCEDVCRFIWHDQVWADEAKSIRHQLSDSLKNISLKALLDSRDIERDGGQGLNQLEIQRTNSRDLFMANIQRVKEAFRVLEEVSKMCEPQLTNEFKKERFRVYEFEKQVLTKQV